MSLRCLAGVAQASSSTQDFLRHIGSGRPTHLTSGNMYATLFWRCSETRLRTKNPAARWRPSLTSPIMTHTWARSELLFLSVQLDGKPSPTLTSLLCGASGASLCLKPSTPCLSALQQCRMLFCGGLSYLWPRLCNIREGWPASWSIKDD